MIRLLIIIVLSALTGLAQAEVFWRGDFESGDTNQWTYRLNPVGINVTTKHKAAGKFAAHIVIRGGAEYLWNDNSALNRVELQYKPDALRTAEHSDSYFGWSFMLPRPFANSRHEFGYWESSGTYRQVMRFNLSGNDIGFQLSDQSEQSWNSRNILKPGHWHDIAMHIHWAVDSATGHVSIWFDGVQVVKRIHAQTLVSVDESMFIQLGILRDRSIHEEEIYIDNAIEASSIREVLDHLKQI
jgi:hypothetical protein